MAVCQSGQAIPDSTFCSRFNEFVIMMASVWYVCHFGRPATVLGVWLLLPLWSDWRWWLCRHLCLCVQSLLSAWLWISNQTSPLWLSQPCKSVSCGLLFDFDEHLYFFFVFFQLTINEGVLAAESCSRVWTDVGDFPSLTWLRCVWPHTCWVSLSATCLLPVYTSFSLWHGVESWDSAWHLGILWLAPPCVLFPLVAGPAGSPWP